MPPSPKKPSKPAAPVLASATETSDDASPAYEPVGEVVELSSAERDGVTVRVLQDDARVWKEFTA